MIENVQALFSNHGFEIGLSVLSFVLGSLIGRLQGWRQFAKRAFLDRTNVSLNFIGRDGEFAIRTLLERSGAEIFRNAHMLRRVTRAAERGGDSPLLDLPDEDYWYYLNAVLNVISEQFADGYVRQEAGLVTEAQTYLLFLTSEDNERMRQKKVRAMLVRESLLKQAADLKPSFRNEFHKARWDTLLSVAEEWSRTQGKSPRIRSIAICV